MISTGEIMLNIGTCLTKNKHYCQSTEINKAFWQFRSEIVNTDKARHYKQSIVTVQK